MSNKAKILFLAANPRDSSKRGLDEEIREVHSKIRAADFPNSFELVSRWAVRPLDLLQALNEVQPHIVHFSGYGSQNAELVLEDDDGNAKPVREAALVSLFKNVKDNIRLVLLNACHSEGLALAISQHVECTVGMSVAIGDEAAIIFASTFYGALAFGRSVGQAFEQGRTALMLQGIPEEDTPILLTRPGSDALMLSFVNRRPVNPVLPPIALEILQSAVAGDAPINFVQYEGCVDVLAGGRQFDCQGNLEHAALLEHAVTMLVQVGWLKQTDRELLHVTHAGYEAARKLAYLNQPETDPVNDSIRSLKKSRISLRDFSTDAASELKRWASALTSGIIEQNLEGGLGWYAMKEDEALRVSYEKLQSDEAEGKNRGFSKWELDVFGIKSKLVEAWGIADVVQAEHHNIGNQLVRVYKLTSHGSRVLRRLQEDEA